MTTKLTDEIAAWQGRVSYEAYPEAGLVYCTALFLNGMVQIT